MAEVRRGVKYSSPSPLEGEGWGEGGGDFLFNVNSLSSPYVVGGPKSLISRRGIALLTQINPSS